MRKFTRITRDPEVCQGKPCIRGMRVTVSMVLGLLSSGATAAEVLRAYPYLEEADILEAIAYASYRVDEVEVPLARAS